MSRKKTAKMIGPGFGRPYLPSRPVCLAHGCPAGLRHQFVVAWSCWELGNQGIFGGEMTTENDQSSFHQRYLIPIDEMIEEPYIANTETNKWD